VNESVPTAPAKSAFWIRVFSRVPLFIWYPIARFLAFLAWRVFPYRIHVVRKNLELCFPELASAERECVVRDYYRGFADVLVEVAHSLRLTPREVERRVSSPNAELVKAELAKGKPVLLMAAHQCNWEWLLLALSTHLGYPVDAAYKPLVDTWAEREMLKLRGRLGARLVPAPELLGDIIQRRNVVRAIALVADQEPVNSERKHWLKFLHRDTAFFVGAEEIQRTTRYAVFFTGLKRVGRGHYEIQFLKMSEAGETLPPGEFTTRYAKHVEVQIRSAPADWPWSHKRWKLKKPLYGAS
jgi:Kdo2-lipid IVA lauroyltransferase/acyltransferase